MKELKTTKEVIDAIQAQEKIKETLKNMTNKMLIDVSDSIVTESVFDDDSQVRELTDMFTHISDHNFHLKILALTPMVLHEIAERFSNLIYS